MRARLDAVVVGSGPNGLAAAVVLAAAGLSVRVYEMAPTPGGGCRTEELTLPGYRHDVCSAAHPMAVASGFFQRFGLADRGVRLLQPEVSFAHPLDGGRAGAVWPSLVTTAIALGDDTDAWFRLFAPLVRHFAGITDEVLSPMRRLPHNPGALGRFGMLAIRSATRTASRFSGDEARGLIAGVAAHGMLPLDRPVTGGVGILLGMLGMAVGWPVVEGGSADLVTGDVGGDHVPGGEIVTGEAVTDLAQLPAARAVLLDVAPRALVRLAGDRLPARDRRRAERFRYGSGVCKVDWALAGPVPWTADVCRRSGTVHVGGSIRRDRCFGSRGCRRPPPRAALRAVRATIGGRSHSGARGGAHALGLLSRAGRLDARLERGDGEADRSFCTWVARPRPCLRYPDGERRRGAQPELRRRRHRRRRAGSAPDLRPSGASLEPVPYGHPRRLPLLVLYAARPGCARSVRRVGGTVRPVRHLRHPAAAGHRTSPVGAVVTGGTPNDRGVSAPPRRKPPALSAGCRRPPAPQRLRRR